MNLHSPFRPWEADHGKVFWGELVGGILGGVLGTAESAIDWAAAREMPGRQADANIKVLKKQKEDYDELTKKMRDLLKAAMEDYRDNILGILNDTDLFEKAYPDIPKAALYVPVDPCCEQARTIECNISRTERADDYVRHVNRLHEQNDLSHALSMDPRFLVSLDIQSLSINDLMRGRLPVGDVVEILTDNAEQAALTGRIGNTRKTTARDLGISKLRAQAAGRREFRESLQWLNTSVSPIERQLDIRNMMLTPQQRIELALNQAQLIQQSLQNKNNAMAMKDPVRLAKLQTRIALHVQGLQSRSTRALLQNTYLPNYGAQIVPNLNNNSQLVGAIGQAIQYGQGSFFFGAPSSSSSGYGEQANASYITEDK